MTLKEKLLFIPALIGAGIDLWVDPPRKLKLVVDHEWKKQHRMRRPLHPIAARPMVRPPTKTIHMRFAYRGQDGKEHQSHCSVAIDLEKRRINPTFTSSWLLGNEHRGSGDLGVAILTLPATLLLSPFLIAANAIYRAKEERVGMSRHAWGLLTALKGQLDRETEALLTEALKNTWRHEQETSRKVTLAEAKTLLASCDLHEEHVPKDDELLEPEARGFHWFDDRHEHVADGSFYGSRDHYVRVLGSQFEDADADALVGCHRSRTVRDVTKDD